jgi:hypothetical protein
MIGAMAQGGPVMDLHYSFGEALGTDYFGRDITGIGAFS